MQMRAWLGALAIALTASAAASAAPPPSVAKRCGKPDGGATAITFASADGVKLSGAVLGKGRAGVVLVHEYGADLCNWLPFGRALAAQGQRVLLVDLRCFGKSACPSARDSRIDLDVAAAAAELRRRGTPRVALAGASLGATAVVVAGPAVRPFATVSLSGPTGAELTALAPSYRFDTRAPLRRLRTPALFVAAKDDGPFPASARTMHRLAAAKDKRLEIVAGGAHGTALLADPKLSALVLEFLREAG